MFPLITFNGGLTMRSDTSIIDITKESPIISIIGMDKNAGKTTVLNYLISNISSNDYSIGITSIGRDGEDVDAVTFTPKPRIYIKKGTFIATAKDCLKNSDITREIFNTTDIHTSMGEVIIVKALSDGYIDLAGPSLNSQMEHVCEILKDCGCKKIFVDGAINRKSFIGRNINQGAILATGASLNRNIDKVVSDTSHAVSMLMLPSFDNTFLTERCLNSSIDERCILRNNRGSLKIINSLTSLNISKEISDSIDDSITDIFIKGALTANLFKTLLQNPSKLKNKNFIAEDGTKILIDKNTYENLLFLNCTLKVLNPINILCITSNPTSPYGYDFSPEELLYKLRHSICLPVFDVVHDI